MSQTTTATEVRPTPRTDAANDAPPLDASACVSADFARELERELEDARASAMKHELEAGRLRFHAERLAEVLRPLVAIAEAYRKEGLDECRPSWGDGEFADSQKELFCGRGGKQLLTLEHALRAQAIYCPYRAAFPAATPAPKEP